MGQPYYGGPAAYPGAYPGGQATATGGYPGGQPAVYPGQQMPPGAGGAQFMMPGSTVLQES